MCHRLSQWYLNCVPIWMEVNIEADVGLDTGKDNGSTLGRLGSKEPDGEVGARTTGCKRRGMRGMRADWLSGRSGLTCVKSIDRGGRNELSFWKRERVGLVGGNVPYR